MSTARGAKLKAQYNRVRTSTALRANDMWTNTIGQIQDPQAGSNSAIEAQIYAPTHGGSKRAERTEMAQQLIQAAGYNPSVTDYQGLLTLAKAQGSLGTGTRGACKLCGGLGHMTKQCTNFLTGHNAAAGVETIGLPGSSGMGLLPDPGSLSDLSDLSSDSSSDGSSSSSSDSEEERSKKKSKKSKKKSRGKKDKKDKKDKRDKDKKERSKDRKDRGRDRERRRDKDSDKKSKKDKKGRKERSRSRSRSPARS